MFQRILYYQKKVASFLNQKERENFLIKLVLTNYFLLLKIEFFFVEFEI